MAVRLGRRLRRRACVRSHRGCRRIVRTAHVVFPINCWNPNMGAVKVTVYVHRASHKRRARKVKRKQRPVRYLAPPAPPSQAAPPTSTSTVTADPQASAALSCESAAVSVTIANAATATGPASFDVQGVSYGPLAPGASETIAIPLSPGSELTLTVTSGSATLIAGERIVNECKAEPLANARFLRCASTAEEGFGQEVELTLTNSSTATLPTAPLTIEWEAPGPVFANEPVPTSETIGPLQPGETRTLYLLLEMGGLSTVTVTTGGKQIFNSPVAGSQCVPA